MTLSTHILDTEQGMPAAGVQVTLYRGEELISRQTTDEDGRIANLASEPSPPGTYRLVFHVHGAFFEQVELSLTLAEDRHYHVPLLLSSYACASYRGS